MSLSLSHSCLVSRVFGALRTSQKIDTKHHRLPLKSGWRHNTHNTALTVVLLSALHRSRFLPAGPRECSYICNLIFSTFGAFSTSQLRVFPWCKKRNRSIYFNYHEHHVQTVAMTVISKKKQRKNDPKLLSFMRLCPFKMVQSFAGTLHTVNGWLFMFHKLCFAHIPSDNNTGNGSKYHHS